MEQPIRALLAIAVLLLVAAWLLGAWVVLIFTVVPYQEDAGICTSATPVRAVAQAVFALLGSGSLIRSYKQWDTTDARAKRTFAVAMAFAAAWFILIASIVASVEPAECPE